MSSAAYVRQVIIDALEHAGFKGRWQYDDPTKTALGAAIETTEIVVEALIGIGLIEEVEADA